MQTSRFNDDDPEPAAANTANAKQDSGAPAENSTPEAHIMAGIAAAAGVESSQQPASTTAQKTSKGPNHSFANFWQMVWDNEIHLIVMLCPIIGLMGVEESCLYWD